MAFTPRNWIDGTTHEVQGPSTTAISSAALEDLEIRVTDYVDFKTSVSVTEPPYNALGDGANDDTAEIQAALDAVNAVGGGVVFLPVGTYMNSGTLTVYANTVLRGSGPGTVIKSTAGVAANTALVRLYGDDSSVEDLTVDADSRDGSIAIWVFRDANPGTVIARNTVRNCQILNTDERDACRAPNPTKDFTFENNIVTSCTSGVTLYGSTNADHTGVRIVGNRFRSTGGAAGGIGIQLYTDMTTYPGVQQFDGVLIADNLLTDFPAPTQNIPIELTGLANAVVRGNVIHAATRGISTGQCESLLITGNTVRDQNLYAVELNGGNHVSIVGNTIEDCASLATQTNGADNSVSDLIVADNTYIGTGKSEAAANAFAIRLYQIASTTDVERVQITGNLFVGCEYMEGVMRLGAGNSSANDVAVRGNTYIGNHANSPIQFIASDETQRLTISDNICRLTRNLAAGDDHYGFIVPGASGTCANTVIQNNILRFEGTTAAATSSSGIGAGNVGAHAHTGVVVRGNRISGAAIGIKLGQINSTDIRIEQNDTRDCTSANTPADVPTTASGATVTLPIGPRVHKISGTNSITSLTATYAGHRVTLIFTDANPGTFTDGSNLKLAGNFDPDASDTISLVCDGTDWYETGRSVN